VGLQPARVKNMLATETTHHFHSYKKRKEKEGGEKVVNRRSDRQLSTSYMYMKGPDESRSLDVGIRKLPLLLSKSLTRIDMHMGPVILGYKTPSFTFCHGYIF